MNQVGSVVLLGTSQAGQKAAGSGGGAVTAFFNLPSRRT